jgi:hypothetical protein
LKVRIKYRNQYIIPRPWQNWRSRSSKMKSVVSKMSHFFYRILCGSYQNFNCIWCFKPVFVFVRYWMLDEYSDEWLLVNFPSVHICVVITTKFAPLNLLFTLDVDVWIFFLFIIDVCVDVLPTSDKIIHFFHFHGLSKFIYFNSLF